MLLDEILDRLDRLEQQQGAGGGASEDATPNYLTVDPTTRQIGASFSGVIHASGLYLPASSNVAPVNANRVQWTRAGDGAMLADAYALDQTGAPGNVELHYQSVDPDGTNAALAALEAVDNTGAIVAQIAAFKSANLANRPHAATATAGGNTRKTIDSNGNSDFAQVAGGNQTVTVRWGSVAATGAVVGGYGFTVTKNGTGLYTLDWNPAFQSANYGIAITSITGTFAGLVGGAQTANSCQVGMNVSTTGALIDRFFTFIAVG